MNGNNNPERCTIDDYILRELELSPKVTSPSGKEYNLLALKALILALQLCSYRKDARGHWTKGWSAFNRRGNIK